MTDAAKKVTKQDLANQLAEAQKLIEELKSKVHKPTRPDFTVNVDDVKGLSPLELVNYLVEKKQCITYGDAFRTLNPGEGFTFKWQNTVIDALEEAVAGSSALLVNAQGGYGSKKVVEQHNAWLKEQGFEREVPFVSSKKK